MNDDQEDLQEKVFALEKKQIRLHYRIERNNSIAKKVKKMKGYTCEVCNFNFETKYGDIGKQYIEAHHLTPIATLALDTFRVNIKDDFAVLCANCHRMAHKLHDPRDLEILRELINSNK
jgi:5-methylcytosine-specific restriction protein A